MWGEVRSVMEHPKSKRGEKKWPCMNNETDWVVWICFLTSKYEGDEGKQTVWFANTNYLFRRCNFLGGEREISDNWTRTKRRTEWPVVSAHSPAAFVLWTQCAHRSEEAVWLHMSMKAAWKQHSKIKWQGCRTQGTLSQWRFQVKSRGRNTESLYRPCIWDSTIFYLPPKSPSRT